MTAKSGGLLVILNLIGFAELKVDFAELKVDFVELKVKGSGTWSVERGVREKEFLRDLFPNKS